MIEISSAFDAGNIDVVKAESTDDIRLQIKPDNDSHFYQWFYFSLCGARDAACRLRLINASGAAYAEGWRDYRAVASYDRRRWFRVETDYDGRELVIRHTPRHDLVYYAYFAPYSHERHLDLIASSQTDPRCRLLKLGKSVDGRDLDMLRLTDYQVFEDKRNVWITARQHPGESMAEWFMEGLIKNLLADDDRSRSLLRKAVFHLVPNANPDGSVRGHLRTNALGVNLNREWASPSPQRSPEVWSLLQAMGESGVDLYLDIHGDEVIPYNFLAGCEANPGFNARLADLQQRFKQDFLNATPEFQTVEGYEQDRFGEETLSLASNQVGQRFDCLSFTLEMPFKDNAQCPEPEQGWSPERSMALGASILEPIGAILPRLR